MGRDSAGHGPSRADIEVTLGEEEGEFEIVSSPARLRQDAATRADLVQFMATDLGCSKVIARAVVDSFCKGVIELTARKGQVKINRLGEFRVAEVGPREGRNPRTGEPVPIESGKRIGFRAAPAFKDRVGGKSAGRNET